MDLATYIQDVPRRLRLSAALEGWDSPAYLWQVATVRRHASPALAKEIERVTLELGPEVVPKWTLCPEIWPPPAEAPTEQDQAA